MQYLRRTSVAVALIGAVTIGGVTSAAVASPPRPSHGNVTGGSLKITLDKSTLKAMNKHGFKLSAISPAKFNGKTLNSPIKGGNFKLPTAKVTVGGGFKISHGGKSVSVTKVHSTSGPSGGSSTAVVSGKGRIAAVSSGPGTPTLTPTQVKSSNFTVTLAGPLVAALDKKFNTLLFKSNAEIGTGNATINYK